MPSKINNFPSLIGEKPKIMWTAFLLLALYSHGVESGASVPSTCYACGECRGSDVNGEAVFNAAFKNLGKTNGIEEYAEPPDYMDGSECPLDGSNPPTGPVENAGSACMSMYLNAFAADLEGGLKDLRLSCLYLMPKEMALDSANATEADFLTAMNKLTAAGLEADFKMVTTEGVGITSVTVDVNFCDGSNNCNTMPKNDKAEMGFKLNTCSANMAVPDTSEYNDTQDALTQLCTGIVMDMEGAQDCEVKQVTPVCSGGAASRARRSNGYVEITLEVETLPGSSYNSADFAAVYTVVVASLSAQGGIYASFDAAVTIQVERGGFSGSTLLQVNPVVMAVLTAAMVLFVRL